MKKLLLLLAVGCVSSSDTRTPLSSSCALCVSACGAGFAYCAQSKPVNLTVTESCARGLEACVTYCRVNQECEDPDGGSDAKPD